MQTQYEQVYIFGADGSKSMEVASRLLNIAPTYPKTQRTHFSDDLRRINYYVTFQNPIGLLTLFESKIPFGTYFVFVYDSTKPSSFNDYYLTLNNLNKHFHGAKVIAVDTSPSVDHQIAPRIMTQCRECVFPAFWTLSTLTQGSGLNPDFLAHNIQKAVANRKLYDLAMQHIQRLKELAAIHTEHNTQVALGQITEACEQAIVSGFSFETEDIKAQQRILQGTWRSVLNTFVNMGVVIAPIAVSVAAYALMGSLFYMAIAAVAVLAVIGLILASAAVSSSLHSSRKNPCMFFAFGEKQVSELAQEASNELAIYYRCSS